jgi:NAD+-dependent protein deacetylase sirtuin 4
MPQACPGCLSDPPRLASGTKSIVEIDRDGAWNPTSTAGILKPAVVMFGESIRNEVKDAAEDAIEGAGRLLVLATSLATYSAWRLAKKARDLGMPIAIVNMGGVRGEDAFFAHLDSNQLGGEGVRVEMSTDTLLPALVEKLRRSDGGIISPARAQREHGDAAIFRDMLS